MKNDYPTMIPDDVYEAQQRFYKETNSVYKKQLCSEYQAVVATYKLNKQRAFSRDPKGGFIKSQSHEPAAL